MPSSVIERAKRSAKREMETVVGDLSAADSLGWMIVDRCGNDPSAGSPTETLLRLHLPLNVEVWTTSLANLPIKVESRNPRASPRHSIGRCDGRCVQRAGT
jgi:hypothetical protein